MGTQHEITKKSDLFDKEGSLIQRGWAKKPLLVYNKDNIGKSWLRIKEWDHFSVLTPDFGFQLTIGDIGYITQMSYVWLDFKDKTRETVSKMSFLTKSKLLPMSSIEESIINFPTKAFDATIIKLNDKRILKINDPSFQEKGISGMITLIDNPKLDNTVVVTGYKEDPRLFYYNHKINFMPAEGEIRIGKITHIFEPDSAFGLMDWGRGIWPYRTHWLWGSACGMVEGIPVAFNIGYGFGDLSTHTENIIFYDGKAHKIDEVTFHHDNRDPTKPWVFTSNDNRFTMELTPLIPHIEKLNYGIISLNSSLLHGYYSGNLVLDNGDNIEVENMLGHAEDIFWRW